MTCRPNNAGTVFQTHHNDEETEWLVLRYSAADGVAEYVRITPGSRIGLVTVRGDRARRRRPTCEVTYRLTSLSAAGTRTLEAMTEASYAAMLREWERLIDDVIGRRSEAFSATGQETRRHGVKTA